MKMINVKNIIQKCRVLKIVKYLIKQNLIIAITNVLNMQIKFLLVISLKIINLFVLRLLLIIKSPNILIKMEKNGQLKTIMITKLTVKLKQIKTIQLQKDTLIKLLLIKLV